MSAGVLSVIVVICIGILILSGWSEMLFPGYASITILTVLLGWMLCAGRQLKLGIVQVDIAWAIWIIAAVAGFIFYLYKQSNWTAALLMCSHIFLFSAIWLFMGIGRGIGYGTIPTIPVWLTGLCIGIMGGMMYTSVAAQWAVFTLSYAIGEALLITKAASYRQLLLGSLEIFDTWWITFAAARLCAVFVIFVLRFSHPKVDNS